MPAMTDQLHRWHDAPPGTIHLRSAPPMPCAEEAAIAEVLARVAAGPRAMEMMSYQPQRGLPEHREAGAFWLSREGFEVSAEQMAVTAGAHHGVLVADRKSTRLNSSH